MHITDGEFQTIKQFVYIKAGIDLHPGKKALVCGRLGKRLQHHHFAAYRDYFAFIQTEAGLTEQQICIDLLTTNETYFFREPKHFDWLATYLRNLPSSNQPFRVWSAASSSGEEAYTLAMVLEEHCPQPWSILGSDVSTRVLERARTGHYAMVRTKHIPMPFLKKYCLRGTGSQEGTFLIRKALRERVEFAQINLNENLPHIGQFDLIFLRNVMIYFDAPTKQAVVNRLTQQLRPGGYLCVGHSESLNGLQHRLQQKAPAIFHKPTRSAEA